MQTTYGAGRKHANPKQKKDENRHQLLQLLVCLSVFLAVFIGKGVWPSKVAQTGEQVLQVLRANTDFRAAFTDLGTALSQQESVLGEIGEFCVSVFAPVAQETIQEPVIVPNEAEDAMPPEAELPPTQPPQEIPTLEVGAVVHEVPAQELPEGYNGQWLYLGDMPTATPVMGAVTSQFGYRDHPTKGKYAAHGGVDIAADHGTPVVAFAQGTVAEVGQNDDFGRYLLLQHPNGVSTFYAHCHTVSVKEGEEVQSGQPIAQVGSTGQSTGAHLHFEVRLNEVRLNPTHYIAPSQEA